MLELDPRTPFMLARKMLGTVGDMHLKVREELMCGRYDWFKPIYGTNIESSMIKANKDLQEVIDNGHLIRGHASKKFVKEGKIFTFQGNEPLTYWTDENECIHEDIDNKGRPYVEYIYNSTEENPKIEQWVKCSEDKFRTFTREDCHLYLNAPNLNIRNDFHLFFFGLDKVNLTIKELYQEILIKMQTLVGHVDIKSIMIIDNESLLGTILVTIAHMMANDMLKKSTVLNENLSKLGRIACVKFENVLDAMAIITKRVTVNLPLNNGRNDEPYIVPSKWLLNYIMSINPEAPPLSFQNAGRAFSLHNKQIENCSAELRNHIFGNVADKNRRKKKNTRKAGAKRAAAKRGQI